MLSFHFCYHWEVCYIHLILQLQLKDYELRFVFLLYLTFWHRAEGLEGIIEHDSQRRLWFALSLFPHAGLPNREQLLDITCHVWVFIHMTLTFWGHFLKLTQLCSLSRPSVLFTQSVWFECSLRFFSIWIQAHSNMLVKSHTCAQIMEESNINRPTIPPEVCMKEWVTRWCYSITGASSE